MSLTASAGVGTPGAAAAPAAGRAAVIASVEYVGVQAAPILPAPVAIPAVTAVVSAASPADEGEPVSDPEPDRPVVQAGPGPATPVEGATTLIDPLVIDR